MTWHVQKKTKNVREEEVMEQEELPEDALKSKFNNLRNSKIEIISGLMFEEDEILINGRNYQVLKNVKQKVMEYCMNLITFKKRQNRISHCINSGRHPLKIIKNEGKAFFPESVVPRLKKINSKLSKFINFEELCDDELHHFFLTKEMTKDLFDSNSDKIKLKVLYKRKEMIIEAEKAFVKTLGIDYDEA